MSQYRARAYENMTALAMTNYAAPQENGHSIAFDGIAFDDHGSRDMTVIEADGREEVYIAAIDLDRLRHYRAHEVVGQRLSQTEPLCAAHLDRSTRALYSIGRATVILILWLFRELKLH